MDLIRIHKDAARNFVVQIAPECAGLLRNFQRQDKWLRLPDKMLNIRNNLKIHSYVELYNDEKRIGMAMFMGLLGRQGLNELDSEVSKLSREEQSIWLNGLVAEAGNLDIEGFFPPETEEARRELTKQFEELSEEEKKEAIKRAQLFWSFVFAYFHNVLSLMVHGAKLTTLVPQAIKGDQDAFVKAIQIDRSLTTHHPFFRQRRLEAQEKGESEFLARIAYRENNPTLRGKIRYPGLYMVFACLEAANWLGDFTHNEILELCDEASLDRYQNRIEDVNYLTKRLLEYRRMQKIRGVSMH